MDIAATQHAVSLGSVAAPDQKHWTIASPRATHWRDATCAEIGCLDYQHGWRVRVDALAEEDLHAMRVSGRRYTVLDVAAGETWWVFEPGQSCFRASTHQVPVGRPELYLVGDRGSVRTYDRSDQWVDDCATETDKIVDKIKEG